MSTISNLVRGGVVVAGIGALAFAGGCRSKQEKAYGTPRAGEQAAPGAPSTAGAQSPVASAINDITSDRCSHAAKCQQVGQGKQFETQDQCASVTKNQVGGQINANACPSGIDNDKLNACLDAIRKAGCDADVAGLKECESSTLCQAGAQQPGMQQPGTQQQGAGQPGTERGTQQGGQPGTTQQGAGQRGQQGTQQQGTTRKQGGGVPGATQGVGQ